VEIAHPRQRLEFAEGEAHLGRSAIGPIDYNKRSVLGQGRNRKEQGQDDAPKDSLATLWSDHDKS
jgi:hypothetical protein